jgi:hypothetical protein
MEKAIMQKRLAGHHFDFGRLNLKQDGFSTKHLKSIATAFKSAPIGSVLYIMQLSFYSLKNRFRITRNNPNNPLKSIK